MMDPTDARSLVVFLGEAIDDGDISRVEDSAGRDRIRTERLLLDDDPDGLERCLKGLVAAKARVCVVAPDVGEESALALARLVDSRHPEISVIVVAPGSPALWREASRAGISEIVEPDASLVELVLAIDVALGRSDRWAQVAAAQLAASQPRTGHVSTVLSPKGGSGKTMLSTNLAIALAELRPGRVVLVDFDCQFGDVGTALGLSPERTLGQLAEVVELDSTSVKVFLTQHEPSGLFVLCSSGGPEEAEAVNEEMSRRIIEILAGDFDHVLVDTAAGLDERSIAAVDMADTLVFLASMDVASVRNLHSEMGLLTRLGVDHADHLLVLNKETPKAGLSVADVEKVLEMPVFARIPADTDVVLAMNQGVPLALSSRKSEVAKAVRSLAATIDARRPGGRGTSAPDANRRSLFRRRIGGGES